MTAKPLSCPFCGHPHTGFSTWTATNQAGSRELVAVLCSSCGARGPADTGWEKAVQLWNKRRPVKTLVSRFAPGGSPKMWGA